MLAMELNTCSKSGESLLLLHDKIAQPMIRINREDGQLHDKAQPPNHT